MSKKIYKIGKVCNFKELTNFVGNKKINAITISLFTLSKSSEYKNFQIYLKGLKEIIDIIMFEEPFDKFYCILFIDDSITENKEIYENIKKIMKPIKNRGILFKYDCPKFKYTNKEKKGLHFDLIGTLMRYIPYFEFENNPIDFILCLDADHMLQRLDKFKIITKIAFDNKADFCYKSFDSELVINRKNVFPRHKDVINHKIPYSIVGHNNCGFAKLPINVFTDYLIDVKKHPEKYQKYCNIKEGTDYKYFCYGIDEYFLNSVFIEALNKYNKKVIPYIPYNFFGTIGINNYLRDKPELQKLLNIKSNNAYKFRYISELKNKDNYDEYINIYNKIYKLYKDKNYSIIDKPDLLSIQPYPNYICRKYYKIYIGGKFIKDVDLFYVKIVNDKIIIKDNLKDYNLTQNID